MDLIGWATRGRLTCLTAAPSCTSKWTYSRYSVLPPKLRLIPSGKNSGPNFLHKKNIDRLWKKCSRSFPLSLWSALQTMQLLAHARRKTKNQMVRSDSTSGKPDSRRTKVQLATIQSLFQSAVSAMSWEAHWAHQVQVKILIFIASNLDQAGPSSRYQTLHPKGHVSIRTASNLGA